MVGQKNPDILTIMLSLVINAGYEGGEIGEKNKHITRGRLVLNKVIRLSYTCSRVQCTL